MLLVVLLVVGSPAAAATTAGRATAPAELDATLLLDFTPNAVHAGIYTRDATRGYDEAEGVDLTSSKPTASTDAVAAAARPAASTSRSSTSTTSRSRASAGATSSA